MREFIILKKNGTKESWNPEKIVKAVGKSASRILVAMRPEDNEAIILNVIKKLEALNKTEISIEEVHSAVEYALDIVKPEVAKSYRDFRNYKNEISGIMDAVMREENRIRYIGDRSNANKDASLVATKRSLVYGEWSTKMFENFYLNKEELEASKDGYIYIHDKDSRRDTINCCLFDLSHVMSGGFQMGNMWYNEPNSLDTAFDVMGDIILATAAQQYGGFTVPEVDKTLMPYAEKSYKRYYDEKINTEEKMIEKVKDALPDAMVKQLKTEAKAEAAAYALQMTQRECEQGMQGIEYKLNTVGSSRGDYPFTTFTFGLAEGELGKMICKTILNVRKEGQGKKGFKKPVLFPKLVFLYDEELHGVGKPNEDVFEAGIDCSSKTMYPDWLSLSGEGYVCEMYKKYKKIISPMGKC